jgi:hypothetical protein
MISEVGRITILGSPPLQRYPHAASRGKMGRQLDSLATVRDLQRNLARSRPWSGRGKGKALNRLNMVRE